jgi:phosphatidylglycerophosphate synthase
MLTKLRPGYEKVSMFFGKASLKLGIYPDFWTFSSLLISVIAAYLITQHHFIWGLVMIIAMNLADALDGGTARAGNICTPFGTVFDHSVDRYAEFIILTGFILSGKISSLTGMFAISGIIMASYVRAKAESAGGIKNCVVGIAGREEKLILMMFSLLFFALGLDLIGGGCIVLSGLISHITAVQRLLYTRRVLFADKIANNENSRV